MRSAKRHQALLISEAPAKEIAQMAAFRVSSVTERHLILYIEDTASILTFPL